MACLVLNDSTSKLELETFSQSIQIPNVYITKAEESTPSNYNFRWSGLSFTLGEVILGTGQEHGDWQSKISGNGHFEIAQRSEASFKFEPIVELTRKITLRVAI